MYASVSHVNLMSASVSIDRNPHDIETKIHVEPLRTVYFQFHMGWT